MILSIVMAFNMIVSVSDSLSSDTGQSFYSQSLEDLYYSLPEECHLDKNEGDTIIYSQDIVKGDTVAIVYSWDANHVLEHIGLRFLDDIDSALCSNPILKMIERESLNLFYMDFQKWLTLMSDDNVHIMVGDKPIMSILLQDRKGICNFLDVCNGISVVYNGNEYSVSLLNETDSDVSVHFRSDPELIYGMNSVERDRMFIFGMMSHKIKDSISISSRAGQQPEAVKPLNDTMYVAKGISYIIPEINNDLYYFKADSVSYTPVFDEDFIKESFSNAMLLPIRNYKVNAVFRVNFDKYEYVLDSYSVYDFFYRNYNMYFGIESIMDGVLKGTLILEDKYAQNIHMVLVSMPIEHLFKGGAMAADFYMNIPQHNIDKYQFYYE